MVAVSEVSTQPGVRDHLGAGAAIGSHAVQHAYNHAFYVILPVIYSSLGLNPITAGLLGSIRSFGSGVASTGGGVVVDRLQHRRLLILYISLATMGLGYLLVGLAPTYILILMAFLFTSMAGSIWHPAARSLLSQIYPRRRGFIISLDRSTGNIGDTIGPLAAGGLLLILAWQQIFLAALPLALGLVLFLWVVLRRAETFQQLGARENGASRSLGEQFRTLKDLIASSGKVLFVLLLVKGLAGLAQGGLMLWIPLYLYETQGMGSVAIGFHVALLTGAGVVTSPVFGFLSDRMGRVPVVILVLAAKGAIAALIALMGTGVMLTVLVGAMGAVMFGINPLVQAWALDIAHGRRLEGTMLGVMYGGNMLFRGGAPLLVGFIVAAFGFGMLFWYVAAMSVAALLIVALTLPLVGRAAPSLTPAGGG